MTAKEYAEAIKNAPKPLQVFSCRRMLPPGTVNYYFSVDDAKIGVNLAEPVADSDKLLHGGLKLIKELKVMQTNIKENIVQEGRPIT